MSGIIAHIVTAIFPLLECGTIMTYSLGLVNRNIVWGGVGLYVVEKGAQDGPLLITLPGLYVV